MTEILLVEDLPNPRKALRILLKNQGYSVSESSNGRDAIDLLGGQSFDLVITDLKMEPIDGMQVLKETKKLHPFTEVIVITAYGTVETGVEAMKLGAYDYITKPFNNEELLLLVKRAVEKRKTLQDVRYLQDQLQEKYQFKNIIGHSETMSCLLKMVGQVAVTDSTVLITGESGTGKELVASAIHTNSQRNQHPMIAINCSALPENLLESELFGHVKGSFTGALRDKKGLFEEADASTVFLDEIGEIPKQTQVKLLRFLQEGEIRRVGDNRSAQVDARLIAATNRNLEEEVARGNFREDLYYRLNVIPIRIPPLRERKEDIPLLIDHFLNKYSAKFKKDIPTISPAVISRIMEYSWPGNVRELENLIERLVALNNTSTLNLDLLSFNFSTHTSTTSAKEETNGGMTLAEMEKSLILDTLKTFAGNQKLTSAKLGISTTTLWRKLKEYQIDLKKTS